jgi:hypothetical protein
MPVIQVRDVPEHIYRRLVETAKRERRSLAQQTLETIAQGLSVETDAKERRRKLIATVREKNARVGRTLSDPVARVREDRER